MTNLYTHLAHARDELRRAKDGEQAIRAIVEGPAQIFGKSADDRKRELALLLAQDAAYKSALRQLRDAEYTVDMAQAALDQAEQERREKEWSIRQRLTDALERQHVATEDDIGNLAQDRRIVGAAQAKHEMDELYPTK